MQNQAQETRIQKMFNDYQIKLGAFLAHRRTHVPLTDVPLTDEIAHSILYAVDKEFGDLEKRITNSLASLSYRFID